MSRRRSRRRSTGSGGRLLPALLVAVLAVGAVGYPLGSTASDASEVPRGVGTNVTGDADAAHALDVAGAVHTNATDPLVNVTNRLGTSVTVTVELRSDSTGLGDLVVDGTNHGDEVSFVLGESGTETVALSVPDDGSLAGETVSFHVNASGTGLDVSATDRTVPVED